MAFIFSDSPPFAFGSQFPVLSFQFSARTLLVQTDYKVARSGAQGHAIQCGQSLNLLHWRCNVYLDLDSKTPLLIEAASGSHQSDESWNRESPMFARIVDLIRKP